MDPEVVAQFNSLQQTGDYIPSGQKGSTGTSSSTNLSSGSSNSANGPLTGTSAPAAPIQTAVDAFFAVIGTPDLASGL